MAVWIQDHFRDNIKFSKITILRLPNVWCCATATITDLSVGRILTCKKVIFLSKHCNKTGCVYKRFHISAALELVFEVILTLSNVKVTNFTNKTSPEYSKLETESQTGVSDVIWFIYIFLTHKIIITIHQYYFFDFLSLFNFKIQLIYVHVSHKCSINFLLSVGKFLSTKSRQF